MKKSIFKTISLVLAFTHLISFCLRDADVAFAKEKESYDNFDLSDAIHAEFIPNEMMEKSAAREAGGAAMMALSGAASYNSTVPPATIQAAVGLNASVLTSFQNDIFTGRSTLSVPISAPAGRKGIKPNISINYSSGNGNGFVGVGWSLEMGAIERSVKKGLPNYTSSDTFLFNSGAGQGELVSIGSGEYRAKIEGGFQKIYFNGTYWEIKDKSGTTYIYGKDSAHRIESGGKIFKWCLQKITDVFGNYMTIDYISDAGQLYPYQIKYAGNSEFELEPTNLVEINYTSGRKDRIVSYRSGFRIATDKLLSDITVYANGQRQRRYHFKYEDNSTNIRSLLKSVTEYGMDDSMSMPEINFEYNYHELGWDSSSTYLPQEAQLGPFSYLADVNNDGYIDILRHYYTGSSNVEHTFLGETDSVWSETSGWKPPITFGWPEQTLRDHGIRIVDVNGDGWVDMIQHQMFDHGDRHKHVYLNNKLNGWVEDTSWNLPDETLVILRHVTNVPMEWCEYMGVVFSDINADGYVDIVRAKGGERYSYINTHSGWQREAAWAMPDGDLSNGSTQFGDLNADGLLDFLIMDGLIRKAYVNIGTGFAREPELDPPDGNFSDGSAQLIDVNEDGLADVVIAADSQRRTLLNKAYNSSHWEEISGLALPEGSFSNYGTRLNDTQGKNTPDLLFNPNNERRVYINRGKQIDYLTRVSNGLGGQIDITYKSSVEYDNTGGDGICDLPFPLQTVESVTVDDGASNVYTSSYEYKNGLFDFGDKEFRGFGYVKTIDPEGNFTENTFLQDDIYKGRISLQQVKDSSGNLYTKTVNSWDNQEINSGVYFVYLSQSNNYTYDGDASYKQTQANFSYDQYGNPAQVASEGDVSVSGDEKTQVTEYIYNPSDWIISLPKHTYLLDDQGTKAQEKWFYYDDHAGIDESPVKGLLTKEESWLSNLLTSQNEKISQTYTYDDYGNLTSATSPLGKTTTTTYDPVYHAYPVRVSNVLGHSAETVYYGINETPPQDLVGFGLFGQVKYTKDANNQKAYNIYDKLGRTVKAIQGEDSEAYPTQSYEYQLSSYPVMISQRTKNNLAPAEYLTGYSFYDGLGRLIEAKSPAEPDPDTGASRQIVSGIVKFDQRGQVKEKYLPYYVSESAGFVTPTYQTPHATFNYDSLGRLVQSINPDSTSSSADYSDWVKTVTDENSNYKTEYYDAYGRIYKVQEHNQGAAYSTEYEYDVLGNLIKVADNQGNISRIWYDSFGRKIKMDDPDMGIWLYTYDRVGNLTSQTDSKAQVLEFEYDALNRLTRKANATNSANTTLATYYYDSGPNAIGRLNKIADQSGSTEFFYDALGREIKSTKSVSGSGAYSVEREYDPLDRLKSLKYPDAEIVTYTYNPQGIEKIEGNGVYVSNVDYSPTGQILKIQYGNGTETNYTYDPDTLRLTNLLTDSPSGKVQDLTYQFDSVGNITQLNDYVNTATQTFLYDDLDRLTQATGSYGSFGYSYDSIGNMTHKEGVSLTYGRAGRLPHAVTQFGNTIIDYDANGNMIKKGDSELSYDIENRLVEVGGEGGGGGTTASLDITLSPGWNFLSIPVIPADNRISSVLSSITGKYGQISKYIPETKKFEHHIGNSKFDQFDSFDYGQGYQIYITDASDVSLTVSGTIPQSESVQLKLGYNLIFCPKTSEVPVEEALLPLQIGVDYSKIYHYNKDQMLFEKYDSSSHEFSQLKPGESYYLYCLNDVTWSPQGPQVVRTEFVYDGDGGRVKKTTGTSATTYIGSLYEITHSSGQSVSTAKHIFAGSNRIAAITSNTEGVTNEASYYHSDHLGSSNVITNSEGNSVGLTEFTPYGSTFKQEGSYDPRHKFTGKELDASTGLYFYGARYYDAELGRFISADTIVQAPYDPQSLNRYTYCRNNPLIYIDPSGNSFWDAVGDFFSNIGKTIANNPGAFIAGLAVGLLTGWAIAGMISNLSGAMAASGAGVTFGEGFILGGMELGIPAFTGTLAGELTAGKKFSKALKTAAIVGGATFVTSGLIEGSYAHGVQNKLHFNDTRIAEIKEIKAQYALGTEESLARAHYMESVVARKGISASTATKLGWPAPKRTVWDKMFKWEGKGEPYTKGWKWEYAGNVEADEFIAGRGGLWGVTQKWKNYLKYRGSGEYLRWSTGTETRLWGYFGSKTELTKSGVYGYGYKLNYPSNKSPWQ